MPAVSIKPSLSQNSLACYSLLEKRKNRKVKILPSRPTVIDNFTAFMPSAATIAERTHEKKMKKFQETSKLRDKREKMFVL